MKPIKRSVAVAITNERGQILVVQRPSDDEDLPDAWGLPAASLSVEESWENAVRRAGRDKLGITLSMGRELNRGSTQRAGYTLEMRLYEARILQGEPVVPQSVPDVTQYRACRWGTPEMLRPAAAQGSLCCRLLLSVESWD